MTAATNKSLAPHPAPLFGFVILSTNVVYNFKLDLFIVFFYY